MAKGVVLTQFSGDPHFNMAVDEWMAWQASRRPALVYLRLYSWQSGAITVGFHQKVETALKLSEARDSVVIRRVTGGRAVYHDPSELTYAVAVDSRGLIESALAGPVGQTAAAIARALVQFLTRVGIPSRLARRSSPLERSRQTLHSVPCFESVSRYEVVAGSHKVVASAQRREGTTFLQHGAIKVNGITPHPALSGNAERSFCAARQSRITPEAFETAAALFGDTMATFFGLTVVPARLSEVDVAQINSRVELLRKNPLARRDFFEHWQGVNSPCDRA